MTAFSLTTPGRTIFSRGCRVVAAAEIARLGQRVLLVRGRSVRWVDTLEEDLRSAGCDLARVFSSGEPVLEDVRAAVSVARGHRTDCVVAVGGGAAIDLGKAVSGLCASEGDPAEFLELGADQPKRLNDPVPFIAIPTTAGTGAEATRNAVIGVPERAAKISLRDPRLVPDLALIDPALTDGAPGALTLATGLDAVTQLVESYLCNRANPVTDAICAGTIPNALAALSSVMDSETPAARDTLARASYLSGVALANSGLGIVHGLASVIGGRGGAHGAICGRLLAASLIVNGDAVVRSGAAQTQRFEQVAAWLGAVFGVAPEDGARALQDFVDRQGLPSLSGLGIAEADYAEVAAMASGASSTKANPVVLDASEIIRILHLSDGARPAQA